MMEKFASVCLSNAREKIMDTSYRSGRGERSNRISKYSRVLCDAATVEWEKEEEEEDGENKRVCVTNVTCAKERGDGRRIEYKCRARESRKSIRRIRRAALSGFNSSPVISRYGFRLNEKSFIHSVYQHTLFFPPFFSLHILINGRWVPARIQPTRNEITTILARCRSSPPLPPSSPSLQSRAFELFDGARHTHEERKKIGRTQTVLPQSLSRFPSRTLSSPLLLLVSPFLSPASLLLKNNATFSPLPPLVLCGFVVTTRLYTPIHFAPQFLATKFPTRDDALFYFSSSSPPFLFLPLFPSLHPKRSRVTLSLSLIPAAVKTFAMSNISATINHKTRNIPVEEGYARARVLFDSRRDETPNNRRLSRFSLPSSPPLHLSIRFPVNKSVLSDAAKSNRAR